jgi:uncharacterized protein (TIGR01244 family)
MKSHARVIGLVVLLLSCLGVYAEATKSAALIEIRNAKQPMPGVLTGGQPSREHFAEFAKAGYKTVINMRTLGEEGAWDETEAIVVLGMSFLHLPVEGADGLTRENTAILASVLDDPESYPVLIHCASGNRVGAMLALKAAWLDGASVDEAMQFGLKAGMTRLEPATRALLEADTTSGQ